MMTNNDREKIKAALTLKGQLENKGSKLLEVTNKSLALKDQANQAKTDLGKILDLVSNFDEIVSKFKE